MQPLVDERIDKLIEVSEPKIAGKGKELKDRLAKKERAHSSTVKRGKELRLAKRKGKSSDMEERYSNKIFVVMKFRLNTKYYSCALSVTTGTRLLANEVAPCLTYR